MEQVRYLSVINHVIIGRVRSAHVDVGRGIGGGASEGRIERERRSRLKPGI